MVDQAADVEPYVMTAKVEFSTLIPGKSCSVVGR